MQALLDSIFKGSIVCYDISKPFYLTSNASKYGLDYVLSHDCDQKEIVWVGSRILSASESNYSNVKQEALAIVEAKIQNTFIGSLLVKSWSLLRTMLH